MVRAEQPGTFEVRLARRSDLKATASIHHRALPGGFFARLGRRFLRTYHASFVAGPDAAALVAEQDGRVVGMLFGTTDNAAHYPWVLRRRGPRLALVGLLALLLRPKELVEFLRTRTTRYLRAFRRALSRRSGRGSAGAAAGGVAAGGGAPHRDVAVLTHVAVDPDVRAGGVGRLLVTRFVELCREADASEIRLITDRDGGASGFYRALGWLHVADRAAADGTLAVEFRLPLQETESV